MVPIDIITIEDSPLRPRSAPVSISHKTPTTAPLKESGYSSEESLPDLPLAMAAPVMTRQNTFPGTSSGIGSKVSAQTNVPKTIPQGCHTETMVVPSSIRSAYTSQNHKSIGEVIDLDSTDDENQTEDEPAAAMTAAVPPRGEMVQGPLAGRVATISLNAGGCRQSSDILQNIDKLLAKKSKSVTHALHRKRSISSAISLEEETQRDFDQLDEVPEAPKKQKTTKSDSAKALKAAERLEIKRKKDAEKEAKLREKREAQSIAAVNTLKKSKKDSTPEMIVGLCETLKNTAFHNHAESFMTGLGCSMSLESMPVAGLVRLRREVKARYDSGKGYWLPLDSPEVVEEDQLIVFLKAPEYVKLTASQSLLKEHVQKVRSVRPTAKILYLIEGLAALVRKSQTARNRAYQATVRSLGGDAAEVPAARKKASTPIIELTEDDVEDSLVDLQVTHKCFIVHSTSPADSAEQLSVLISDVSTVPYRTERENLSLAFCTEVGQIKTGADERDTFEKMLQSIVRVTPQISQAIAARYSGMKELCVALTAGPQILSNIPKGHNVDGTVTGQLLGTATAQKIHRALMTFDAHAEA